jgi:hypothetical protein
MTTPLKDTRWTGLALSILFVASKGVLFDVLDVRRSLLGDLHYNETHVDERIVATLDSLVDNFRVVDRVNPLGATPSRWIIRNEEQRDYVRRLFPQAYPEMQLGPPPLNNDDAMLGQLDDSESDRLDALLQKAFGADAATIRDALVVKYRSDRTTCVSECVRLAGVVELESRQTNSRYEERASWAGQLVRAAHELQATIECEQRAVQHVTGY